MDVEFVPFNRDQAFLQPPDPKVWLPADDLAHFMAAAADRVPLGALVVPSRTGGMPEYHPRLMSSASLKPPPKPEGLH